MVYIYLAEADAATRPDQKKNTSEWVYPWQFTF